MTTLPAVSQSHSINLAISLSVLADGKQTPFSRF